VVYGDIGTSPLYALKEVFAHGRVPLSPDNILGVLSLVFWTMTVVVSLKYVLLILRADNNGEGGLIAMLALATQAVKDRPALRAPAAAGHVRHRHLLRRRRHHAGDLGAGAVEGLEVAAPALHRWVIVPMTLLVLTGAVRGAALRHGGIGKLLRAGDAGVVPRAGGARAAAHRCANPQVLVALSRTTRRLRRAQPGMAFVALGAVVLCVTGGEALYADLGHFGKRPIRWPGTAS
jgi:KUP system potassium uptake protein